MFEWDENKSQRNMIDRGFDFTEIYKFDWETAKIKQDDRKDYGEDRYWAFGFCNSKMTAVTFTPRGKKIRIISMRRMHRKEGVTHGIFKEIIR